MWTDRDGSLRIWIFVVLATCLFPASLWGIATGNRVAATDS